MVRRVPIKLCLIEVYLPTIKLEVDKEDRDIANAAY